MEDKGQFKRIEYWDRRELVIDCVIHPAPGGGATRIIADGRYPQLVVALDFAAIIMALEIQDSQRDLVKQLMEDLATSLADYPVEEDDDDLPFEEAVASLNWGEALAYLESLAKANP